MKRTFAKLLSLFVVLTLVIAMVPAVFAVGEKVSAGKNTLSVNESTTVSVTDANGTAVPNVTLSSDHDDIVSVIDSSTIKALKVYTEVSYEPDCYIMFGKESAGIPEEILVEHEEDCMRIPMNGDIRSLNLGNSVAIVLYEALRQNGFAGMNLSGELHELHWK